MEYARFLWGTLDLHALSPDDRYCCVDDRGNLPPVFSSVVIVPSAGVEDVPGQTLPVWELLLPERGSWICGRIGESPRCWSARRFSMCSLLPPYAKPPHGRHMGLQIG
ncbi:hypothetical protein KL921_004936 [Ogataea angusta]|nr:hypothetical protein KL921_004936 [Ogataea angusta]KAG7852966.1 hypothetical protein KL941_000016 [Ogataea angusta]